LPFPNWIGKKRLWTKERVIAGLVAAAGEIEGPLPCLDASYSRIKKGCLDWPPATRVLEYFGAMSRGWLAVGEPMERVSLHNVPWTEEEKAYLLEYAGNHTLKRIAQKLGRSYGAVRGQLRITKIASRHNQGYLSAAELAKEYNCSCHRIRQALAEGKIKGGYDRLRNRWQIDLKDLTPEAQEILTRPKRTHKTCATALGDYYIRYGLCRRVIDGRVMVVAAT